MTENLTRLANPLGCLQSLRNDTTPVNKKLIPDQYMWGLRSLKMIDLEDKYQSRDVLSAMN